MSETFASVMQIKKVDVQHSIGFPAYSESKIETEIITLHKKKHSKSKTFKESVPNVMILENFLLWYFLYN